MPILKPLDPLVPIEKQLATEAGPVILINIFTSKEEDVPALMSAWEVDANWMKRQPGYISTQLLRAIGGSCVLANYAVWDSVEQFRAAFSHPDFKARMGAYPPNVVSQPHLFARVAVPNLCTS